MNLKIGDLVQLRDNHYNRGLGIVGKIGMLAELRRRDIRILFDADNQGTWVSKLGVNRIVLPPAPVPTLLDRLTWLISFLAAEECELESADQETYRCTLVAGELSLDKLHSVRDYMGSLFVGMRIVPRGMSRLGLEIVFRRGQETAGR